MWELVSKYLLVFVSSMFKFFVGPVIGTQMQLPFWHTYLLTVGGMMISVFLFTTIFGNIFQKWLRDLFFKNQKLFTKVNRLKVNVWKKFGIIGVAFLTPLIFTPIGGTILANGFETNKGRIYLFMFISACLWAFVAIFIFNLFPSLLPK